MSIQVNKCGSQGVYIPTGDLKEKVLSILENRKVDPDSLIKCLQGAASKKDLQIRCKSIRDPSLKKAVEDISKMDLTPISIGEIIAMISKVARKMKISLVKYAKTWSDSMDETLTMGVGAASTDKMAKKLEAISGMIGGALMAIGGGLGMSAGMNEGMLRGELSEKLGDIIENVNPQLEEEAVQSAMVEDVTQEDTVQGDLPSEEVDTTESDMSGRGAIFSSDISDIDDEPFPEMDSEVGRGTLSLEREEADAQQAQRDERVKAEVNKQGKSYKHPEDRAIRKEELENEYKEKTSKWGADMSQKMQMMSQAFNGVLDGGGKLTAAPWSAQSGILNSYRDLLSSEKTRRQGLFDAANKLQDGTTSLGQVVGRYIQACAIAV